MNVLCGVVLLVTALVVSTRGGPVGSLRIVNGTEISIEKVPYQVYLDVGCGGSILTSRHIVTAAHCSTYSDIKFIRAGSSNEESGGQVVNVAKKINHPKYKWMKNSYDFALLVLAEDLVFNENVKSITLAREPAPDGTIFLTSGWGETEHSPNEDNFLRAVELPQVNRDVCQTMYNEFPLGRRYIDQSMVCAGYEEGLKSACFGDSGGPLVFNSTLYGVASWIGEPCGAPRLPNVFANIPEVYDWYMNLIKDSM